MQIEIIFASDFKVLNVFPLSSYNFFCTISITIQTFPIKKNKYGYHFFEQIESMDSGSKKNPMTTFPLIIFIRWAKNAHDINGQNKENINILNTMHA